MITTTFKFERFGGGVLCEKHDGKRWWMEYTEESLSRIIPMYDIDFTVAEEPAPYLGHTLEEISASGKDILGRILMAKGEVEYSDLIGALPKITENSYCFIGSPAGHSDMTVDTRGAVYRQLSGRDIGGEAAPDYEPWNDIPELLGVMPMQVMLGEEFPVIINVYRVGEETVEIIYFIEPCDSARDGSLWIRTKRYKASDLGNISYTYDVKEFMYELHLNEDKFVNPATVMDALADTVAYWAKFAENGTSISIPEKRLERVTRGAMAAAAVTCTGDRPHYGHKYYGKEIHDNFPPNYIWLIEAATILGREDWAKRIFEEMINYALTDEGKIVYRQGRAMSFGASATEYGCLLFLADRYFDKLAIGDLSKKQIKKIIGMGDFILHHAISCPEFGGKILVKMCAEADTNCRVYVYLNNNLWAIRGLRALTSIIEKLGLEKIDKYSDTVDILWQNVEFLLNEKAVKDERFGLLPPFRFDYPPVPTNLSYCRDTFYPMSDEEYEEYSKYTISRSIPKEGAQDITENCYANYRYYPEMLSAMLLPDEMADGAENLRDNLGGVILGMTRFRSWIDNWPVLHHARYLIESGRINKYLLLLYAHTELHGNREKLCYYEQVKLFGKVSAHDCLPSLLTTPIMVAWMFAYEKMKDGNLSLLRAVPKAWFDKEFSVSGICYSDGSVSIDYKGGKITVQLSSPSPDGMEIVWRGKDTVNASDITLGGEFIEGINGNSLLIKGGQRKIVLEIK